MLQTSLTRAIIGRPCLVFSTVMEVEKLLCTVIGTTRRSLPGILNQNYQPSLLHKSGSGNLSSKLTKI